MTTICTAHKVKILTAAAILAATTLPPGAFARGGSDVSVAVTATVSGSVVSGVINISNAGSSAVTVTAIESSLEVRFASGETVPPLPAGSNDGWYKVVGLALAAPLQIKRTSTASIPFSISTCGSEVAAYDGAKDMRAVGQVTVGRVRTGRSPNFALPADCPVCGNYISEEGEQCDAGPAGTACCTAACELQPNGTTCSDDNACTQSDQCQAGQCVGSDPIVCDAGDQCRNAGTCNPSTGTCAATTKANGTACNDDDACTQIDSCQSGTCRGTAPVACTASGPCLDASCDSTTGSCVESARQDGSSCSDGNACTQTDQCQAGSCIGGAPVVCTANGQCHDAGSCNPNTGICTNPVKANGSPCDDQNACTQTDSCIAGSCQGAGPVVCAASGSCTEGTCDPTTGSCSDEPKPDGTECMDGDTCTVGDMCQSGECVSGDPRDCDDHLSCTTDSCQVATGCDNEATPGCEVCDATECALCRQGCDADSALCQANCWSGFLQCVNGCTSTYCAPFCQVDLGYCLNACPSSQPCWDTCDTGNACAQGCIEP